MDMYGSDMDEELDQEMDQETDQETELEQVEKDDGTSSQEAGRLQISQMICSFHVGMKLSTLFLVLKLSNIRYNYGAEATADGKQPDMVDRVHHETKAPVRARFIIHPSGVVRMFGARTVGDARMAAAGLVANLRQFPDYRHTRVVKLKVGNIVAGKRREDYFPVNLNRLKEALLKDGTIRSANQPCYYEPGSSLGGLEQELKVDGKKVMVMVFSSGAVTVVGAKTVVQMRRAFDLVHPHVVSVKVASLGKTPERERVAWKDMSKFKRAGRKETVEKSATWAGRGKASRKRKRAEDEDD